MFVLMIAVVGTYGAVLDDVIAIDHGEVFLVPPITVLNPIIRVVVPQCEVEFVVLHCRNETVHQISLRVVTSRAEGLCVVDIVQDTDLTNHHRDFAQRQLSVLDDVAELLLVVVSESLGAEVQGVEHKHASSMINLEVVIVANTSGFLLVIPLPDSMGMPNTFPKASARVGESLDIQSRDLKRPAWRTATSTVATPDILMGAHKALDTVLRHQLDQLAQVRNVLHIQILRRRTRMGERLPGDEESHKGGTPRLKTSKMQRRIFKWERSPYESDDAVVLVEAVVKVGQAVWRSGQFRAT
ncbi:hypothetical protein HG530_006085 [Fusarium avenaceum]|nr:hypothetical protein HG530_006085 [Fusarium avenaceum]